MIELEGQELVAVDLRSGLEVERLELGASKLKVPSGNGTSLAASPRRVILLVEAPGGRKIVLVYEVV